MRGDIIMANSIINEKELKKGFGNWFKAFLNITKNNLLPLLVSGTVGFFIGGMCFRIPARMTAILAILVYYMVYLMVNSKKKRTRIMYGILLLYPTVGITVLTWGGGSFLPPIITAILVTIYFVAVIAWNYTHRRIRVRK